MKAGNCLLRTERTHFQRKNFVPKKLFRFPGNYKSMDRLPLTPAQKRTQIRPVLDNDIIRQLRLLSDDSDEVMD